MKIPGFTADASLREPRAQSHATSHLQHAGGVHPAQATRFFPFTQPTSISRPVPSWHKDLFERYCTVIKREYLDQQTGRWIKLCVRRCADGSVRPIPC